jgi:hypothetical protein
MGENGQRSSLQRNGGKIEVSVGGTLGTQLVLFKERQLESACLIGVAISDRVTSSRLAASRKMHAIPARIAFLIDLLITTSQNCMQNGT